MRIAFTRVRDVARGGPRVCGPCVGAKNLDQRCEIVCRGLTIVEEIAAEVERAERRAAELLHAGQVRAFFWHTGLTKKTSDRHFERTSTPMDTRYRAARQLGS